MLEIEISTWEYTLKIMRSITDFTRDSRNSSSGLNYAVLGSTKIFTSTVREGTQRKVRQRDRAINKAFQPIEVTPINVLGPTRL